MNEKRDHIDSQDIETDIDRESLSEISDISLRLKTIAQLDALEARGVHVEAIVERIDPTSNLIFSAETERIHDGDIHYGQEGVDFEPQIDPAPRAEESHDIFIPKKPQEASGTTFGSEHYIATRRTENGRNSLRTGALRGKTQPRGRTRPKGH